MNAFALLLVRTKAIELLTQIKCWFWRGVNHFKKCVRDFKIRSWFRERLRSLKSPEIAKKISFNFSEFLVISGICDFNFMWFLKNVYEISWSNLPLGFLENKISWFFYSFWSFSILTHLTRPLHLIKLKILIFGHP